MRVENFSLFYFYIEGPLTHQSSHINIYIAIIQSHALVDHFPPPHRLTLTSVS